MQVEIGDIRDWKLRKAFGVYDVNGDGLVDRDDFHALARQTADQLGSTPSDAFTLACAYEEWWKTISTAARTAPGDRLDEARWVAAVKAIRVEDGQYAQQIPFRIVDGMYRMIDTDGSGTLEPSEFARFYRSIGASEHQAREAFAMLDRNGDGTIDLEEFQLAVGEFFFSDDQDASGNWILGRP